MNNSDIVKLLLDYHTNPKIANKNGLTALQLTSDSRIVRLVTDALDKWRDEPEQIMSDVGNATQPGNLLSVNSDICSIQLWSKAVRERTTLIGERIIV